MSALLFYFAFAIIKHMREQSVEQVASTEEIVIVSEETATKPSKKSNKKSSKPFKKAKTPKTEEELKKSKRKKRIIIVVVIILILAIAAGAVWLFCFSDIFKKKTDDQPAEEVPTEEAPKYYSRLSGLEIANEAENTKPIYCVQIPNGADGARPQAGLTEAPVVFEAIAEAGITRFAALFQNAKAEAIGPIRSLRSYYLDWDTPFDCTVVHAGGATDAIAALHAGGYREVDESLVYMWRNYSSYWAPNNLFTSAALLEKAAADDGYSSSNPQTLPRLTPKETEDLVAAARKNAGLDQPENSEDSSENTATESTDSVTPLVKEFSVNFGSVATFNTVYHYDENTNTYNRSYASGEDHIVYDCVDTDKAQPDPKTDCGLARQVSPAAVAVMNVDEYLDTDNYHHVIQTIGTGTAHIFQNGTVTRGTWKKSSKSAQIEFKDDNGNTIAFTPGQLWIAAIPNSGGSVRY